MDALEQYEKHHPIGTKARLALALHPWNYRAKCRAAGSGYRSRMVRAMDFYILAICSQMFCLPVEGQPAHMTRTGCEASAKDWNLQRNAFALCLKEKDLVVVRPERPGRTIGPIAN
jgi:hypothetical protein